MFTITTKPPLHYRVGLKQCKFCAYFRRRHEYDPGSQTNVMKTRCIVYQFSPDWEGVCDDFQDSRQKV